MKRVVFILLLVYASSILNMSELCAQKVQAGWVHVTTEKEKIEKEKKEKKEKEKKEKEKKEVKQKEIKDYTHSIGIAVGSSYGLAYKYFFKDNWALKVDATDNFYRSISPLFMNFDFNPNVVFQLPLKAFKTCRLDFFAGGGTTFGYDFIYKEWQDYHSCVEYGGFVNYYLWDETGSFVWGINGIFGLEINLSIPMSIEFDLRPGYGLFAGNFRGYCYYCKNYLHDYTANSFFDWSLNATISYKF